MHGMPSGCRQKANSANSSVSKVAIAPLGLLQLASRAAQG